MIPELHCVSPVPSLLFLIPDTGSLDNPHGSANGPTWYPARADRIFHLAMCA